MATLLKLYKVAFLIGCYIKFYYGIRNTPSWDVLVNIMTSYFILDVLIQIRRFYLTLETPVSH